ncbi:uncharacterized protein F54H12.2-like [Saccostrea echinata]|uniref:uncharacterized protein F54H12.2-like n=1 Tax=Saccostrea echinata TaxID=191078 RepID=UPI002A83BAE6|nr:uncharacterized protein F54H12.2-like [Saccostrea echinata]
MSGPTYISNPALWEQFHHTEGGENFIPSIRRNAQRGGGILNIRKAYMIPLKSRNPVPNHTIHQVTPVAAEQERALSDLKKTIRNDEPHMPLKKTIKRKKTKKSISRTSTSKGRGRSEINTSVAEPSELSLFSDPPNQVAVQKIYFSEIRPISSFDGETAPLEFAVPGGGNEYLDLRRSRLYLKAKITKADVTALTSSEKTGIVNLPLQSLFSQIDVYINGKCISQNANNYPWKAYLKVLLSNGPAATSSQLQTQLYYPDKEALDDPDAAGGRNQGLRLRYVFTQLSKTFDLEGPLYVDCFYLDKYLMNGVDLQLRLFRSRSEFVLMSKEASPNYKVTILDAVFKACKIRLDSAVLLNHATAITKSPARYNYLKTDVKMMTISDKTSEVYWDDVWNGRRPSKMYVAFVKQSAVNGSYEGNPLNFQHLSLSEIVVTVNGEPTPVRPLKMDFETNRNYVSALCNLYQASKKWYKDDGLIIDRDQFSKGYAIYAFDLDPNDLGEGYINLVHQGNVGVYARFATPTSETVSALAFCEYPGLLLVDQAREIRLL